MPPQSLLVQQSHPNQSPNPPEPNHRQIANPRVTTRRPISKLLRSGSIIVMNPASKQPSRNHSQSGKVQRSIYTPASCRRIDRNSLFCQSVFGVEAWGGGDSCGAMFVAFVETFRWRMLFRVSTLNDHADLEPLLFT